MDQIDDQMIVKLCEYIFQNTYKNYSQFQPFIIGSAKFQLLPKSGYIFDP